MSVSLSINVVNDTARPFLAELQAGLAKPRLLNAKLGGRVKDELVSHFLAHPSEPNKRGFPTQSFYQGFSQRIVVEPRDDGATVAIGDPSRALARKINGGGPITPKEAKSLAIPQTAEAYGKSPRDFNDLRYIALNRGNLVGALVERTQTPISFGRRRKDGSRKVTAGEPLGGKVFYFLVRSVNPPKDPDALPSTRRLQAAVRDEAVHFLNDLLSQSPGRISAVPQSSTP